MCLSRRFLSYKTQPEGQNNNNKTSFTTDNNFLELSICQNSLDKNVYSKFLEEKEMSLLMEIEKGRFKHTLLWQNVSQII